MATWLDSPIELKGPVGAEEESDGENPPKKTHRETSNSPGKEREVVV